MITNYNSKKNVHKSNTVYIGKTTYKMVASLINSIYMFCFVNEISHMHIIMRGWKMGVA